MGNARRIKNPINNIPKSKNYIEVLADLLGGFYEFLGEKVKPSDEEVRERFLKYKNSWFLYCDKQKLNNQIKDLFVLNIEKMWKHNQVN